jgi:hypothetical protein
VIGAASALAARVPWLKVLRVALPALAIALLAGALWWAHQVIERTRIERDAAVADVVEFRRLATDATVPPAADGTRPLLTTVDAKAALAGAFRDRDNARAELGRIDRDTKAARQRADRADAALAQEQAANRRRFDAAQGRIAALEAVKPSADAAADAAGIDDDSKAAWESWR